MRKFFLVLSVMLYTTAAFAQEKENILYILDGKIVSKADLDKVNPACIKSANVVKGFDKAMIITTGESSSRNRNCDFAVVGINGLLCAGVVEGGYSRFLYSHLEVKGEITAKNPLCHKRFRW